MNTLTIMRVRRQRDDICLSRALLENKDLSYAAVGLLIYLLSLPDNQHIAIRDLVRKGAGRDKAYRLVDECIEAGYVKRVGGYVVLSEAALLFKQEVPDDGNE